MIRWVVYEVELPPPSEHACGPDCMCFQSPEAEEPVEINAFSEEHKLELVRRRRK
jgi:hypothetical protein